MREQQARQQEMGRQIKTQMEGHTQNQLRGLNGPSTVVPLQKFEQTISQDEKGNYSRSFKTVDATPKEPKDIETIIYRTSSGENRIGKKDPTGAVIQTPNDPLAENQPKNTPDLEETLRLREESKLRILAPKEKKFVETANAGYDRIIKEAEAIKNDPDLKWATGLAAPISGIFATKARMLKGRIGTLKSKSALTTLQAIRNASVTGGAIGQVSDRDIQLLMDEVSNLDPGQKTEDFRDAIQRVIDNAMESKKRASKIYDETYGGVVSPAGQGTSAAATTTPASNGYISTATNPKTGERVGTRDGKTWEKIP
jgi:hypothetical protein